MKQTELKLLNTSLVILAGVLAIVSVLTVMVLPLFLKLKSEDVVITSVIMLLSAALLGASLKERSELVRALAAKRVESIHSHSGKAFSYALFGAVGAMGVGVVLMNAIWVVGAILPAAFALLALVEKTRCFVEADSLSREAPLTAHMAEVLKGDKNVRDPRLTIADREARQREAELGILEKSNPTYAGRQRAKNATPAEERERPKEKGKVYDLGGD